MRYCFRRPNPGLSSLQANVFAVWKWRDKVIQAQNNNEENASLINCITLLNNYIKIC